MSLLYHPCGPDGRREPAANREDTMYLNVLRPYDYPQEKTLAFKDYAQALRVEDIPGATQQSSRREFYTNGPPVKDEIWGTCARTRYPPVNRIVDMSLTVCDIERAQPNTQRFRTSRVVNPLTPRYELPTTQQLPVEPPRARFHEGQMRDSLEHTGRPEGRLFERSKLRDPNCSADIYGTTPGTRGRLKGQLGSTVPRDLLRTIEQAGARILSSKASTPRGDTRSTNPLVPLYKVSVQTTHPFLKGGDAEGHLAPRLAGHVEGSTPRVLHRDNGEPQNSLIRTDIAGAVPQRFKGLTPFNLYDPPEVTPHADHLGLDCSDIPGAQAGTRMPGTL